MKKLQPMQTMGKLPKSLREMLKTHFPAWKNCTIRAVDLGDTFGYIIYREGEGELIAVFKADPSTEQFFSLSEEDILKVLKWLCESDPNFKVSEEDLKDLTKRAKAWIFPPEDPVRGLRLPFDLVTFFAAWLALFPLPSKKVSLDAFWDKFKEVCGDIPNKSPYDYYPIVLFSPHDSTNLPE